MAYQLPLRFIYACRTREHGHYNEIAVCATRIVAILSIYSSQTKRLLLDEKKRGTLINASGNRKTLSAIILDNGTVIASPYTTNNLLQEIENGNETAGFVQRKVPLDKRTAVDLKEEDMIDNTNDFSELREEDETNLEELEKDWYTPKDAEKALEGFQIESQVQQKKYKVKEEAFKKKLTNTNHKLVVDKEKFE